MSVVIFVSCAFRLKETARGLRTCLRLVLQKTVSLPKMLLYQVSCYGFRNVRNHDCLGRIVTTFRSKKVAEVSQGDHHNNTINDSKYCM